MSFARGLALAAMAASALTTSFAGNVDLIRETFSPDVLPTASGRYGRSHYAGHRGQFAKKVDRQRRRNQMRRLTHQQQRRAA